MIPSTTDSPLSEQNIDKVSCRLPNGEHSYFYSSQFNMNISYASLWSDGGYSPYEINDARACF